MVLQSVLENVDGDQDKAIDKLLGMSDPEYKDNHSSDQTELDEMFARQLMMEDHEHQLSQVPGNPQYRGYPSPPGQYPEAQTSSNSTSRPEFREVAETFNKIAEGGKKTFNSLFSKVKAKMQEYDQSRNDPYASASGNQYPPGTPSQQDRHTMMQQSYYDPNFQPYEPQAPVSHVQGYDLTSPDPNPQTVTSDNINAVGASTNYSRDSSDVRANSSSHPRANIDPSKLGLLPKNPVSLIDSSPPSKTAPTEDHLDDLEYVENPFEEDARHK